MPAKIVVLDFDGTLADSNSLKYDAYFKIMPEEYASLISQVLDSMFEASRYDIIAEILRLAAPVPEQEQKATIDELAERYNSIVLHGACTCPAIPGALEILELLESNHILTYVSSTTPQIFLREIVEARGWNRFFERVYGFPATKEETLQKIMHKHRVAPSEVLVVGDGESDRRSARALNTRFVPVKNGHFPVGEVKAQLLLEG